MRAAPRARVLLASAASRAACGAVESDPQLSETSATVSELDTLTEP